MVTQVLGRAEQTPGTDGQHLVNEHAVLPRLKPRYEPGLPTPPMSQPVNLSNPHDCCSIVFRFCV